MTRALCAQAAIVWAIATFSYADTLVVQPAKDNTLYEDPAGSLSNALGEHLFCGKVGPLGGNRLRRGLMKFDVSAIPAGSIVNSVSVRVYLDNIAIQGNQTIRLRKILADWGEGTSNALAPGGNGTAATTGDATWVHRFYNTDTWGLSGGDLDPVISASQPVNADGPYNIASNAPLVADVQGWVDAPATNFGWSITGNEVTSSSALRFGSRENIDPLRRPELTVDFTPPPPVPAASEYGVLFIAGFLVAVGMTVIVRRGA